MYRASEFSKIFGLVGFVQDSDPTKYLDSTLTESRSGLKYNAAHSLLTLENLRASWNNPITLEAWSSLLGYVVGNKVKVGTDKYICIQNCTNKNPVSEPLYWTKYDEFSQWLKNETQIAIDNTIQDFIRVKQFDGKQLLESKTLFDGVGNIYKTNQNTHQLVGFEINLVRSKGVTLKLERIGVQFTETGTFKMYLFHSSCKEPIKEIDVEVTKANSINWVSISNTFLKYQSETTDAGGSYYLCYREDDIEGLSINKNYDFSNPCNVCGGGMNILSRYLSVAPFKVNTSDVSSMWDKDNMVYYNTNNFGINLQLSVHCDLTDFIIDNEDQFKDIIQLGVAKHLMRWLAFNPNYQVSRNTRNIPDLMTMLYEIDGNPEGRKTGLGLRYDTAMRVIDIETKGVSPICMPCADAGVKYTSVR